MPSYPSSAKVLPEFLRQQCLVKALSSRGYFQPRPRIEETHISWVLLTGTDAYKIKKAVNLGFLDFSSLDARHFYCSEELRLNRRLAPELYLDILPIGGTPERPLLGKEPAIEYVVHMRRFPQANLMERMLDDGRITPQHMDKLASVIGEFHLALPAARSDSPYCDTATIHKAAVENFDELPGLLKIAGELKTLQRVRKATTEEFSACAQLFEQRALSGYVRECHGDLHLGNIVVLGKKPTPFDCIEFSPALRWTDVISEISFPVMDLLHHGHAGLAWRLLNAYLEITGDYYGCGALRFYLAYRAMVRAKISAIRARQLAKPEPAGELSAMRGYLQLADHILTRRRPMLIITHGLPGCGKTTFSQAALEALGAIRIRSDIERKRLHGLTALADSKAADLDIYSRNATERTYSHLLGLCQVLLATGFPVIVDAAFLLSTEREQFRVLADIMKIPFIIACVLTDPEILKERLMRRSSGKKDASEADYAVMEKLKAAYEPISAKEKLVSVTFLNNGDVDALRQAIETSAVLAKYQA
jgi:aminoglycoside phosphotransferase family enzyme/predicted kinase